MGIIELRDFAGAGQSIEIQLRGYYGWTSGNLASAGSNANAAAPTTASASIITIHSILRRLFVSLSISLFCWICWSKWWVIYGCMSGMHDDWLIYLATYMTISENFPRLTLPSLRHVICWSWPGMKSNMFVFGWAALVLVSEGGLGIRTPKS